jgi:hypothetical protein
MSHQIENMPCWYGLGHAASSARMQLIVNAAHDQSGLGHAASSARIDTLDQTDARLSGLGHAASSARMQLIVNAAH